jgi:hypothetical protein
MSRAGCFTTGAMLLTVVLGLSLANDAIAQILTGQILAGTIPIKQATVTLFGTVETCMPDPCVLISEPVEKTASDSEGHFSLDLAQARAKVWRMGVPPSPRFTQAEEAPRPGSLYLVVDGGDSGKGDNPAIKLVNQFGTAPADGHLVVNELTTIIAAFTPNPELYHQLVDPSTGSLRPLFNRGANSPALANTLADIMHGCVISEGLKSHECESLFQAVTLPREYPKQKPDNTQLAIGRIVSTWGRGQSSAFALLAKARPYAPVLERAPAGWLLSLNFNGLGLHRPTQILADLSDHTLWIMNRGSNSLVELSTNSGDLTSPLLGEKELPAAVRNGAIAFWFATPLSDYPSKARPNQSGWFSQPSAWLVDDRLTFLESDGTLCGTASKSLGLKDAEGLSSCVDFSDGNLCGTALNRGLRGAEGLSNCDNLGNALCIANAGNDKIVAVNAPKSARCDDAKVVKTLAKVKDETPNLHLAEPTHLVRCIQNNAENWITNRASNSVTLFMSSPVS